MKPSVMLTAFLALVACSKSDPEKPVPVKPACEELTDDKVARQYLGTIDG